MKHKDARNLVQFRDVDCICTVPCLPVVAWSEHGNIFLARSFHAAHFDCDLCKKSARKYCGNIVRLTWILRMFNRERNPFLVWGKPTFILLSANASTLDQSTMLSFGREKLVQLFPKRKILDSFKVKEFADDNLRLNEHGRKF